MELAPAEEGPPRIHAFFHPTSCLDAGQSQSQHVPVQGSSSLHPLSFKAPLSLLAFSGL